MITLALVDDNNDLREGLQITINDHPEEFKCLGAFSNAEDALTAIPELNPQVVLMDIKLPGISGIDCVRKLKTLIPGLDVIMLTIFAEDKTVFDSLCAGACGYITKNASPEEILDAVREGRLGGAPLSPRIARMVVRSFNNFMTSVLTDREQEVLMMMSGGNSYKMTADQLHISHDTVRFHIKNIYKKLEVHSLQEAFAKVKKQF